MTGDNVAAGADQLLARIERLEAELREMRAAVHQSAGSDATADDGSRPETATRRRAVGLLAAGAVGAVAAAVGSQPAAAANNDPILLGNVQASTWPTVVNSTLTSYTSPTYETSALTLNAIGRGYGVDAEGSWGNALFRASGAAPIASNARRAGILWVDGGGNWWASVGVNAWRQLAGPSFSNVGPQGPAGPAGPAGPPGTGSAGGFTPLASPVRVYDTRADKSEPGAKVAFGPDETRQIDLTANGSGVPATARAVQISYVIIRPPLGGHAVAWPGGPLPTASQVNYPGGVGEVRGACVAIGAVNGTIQLFSKGGGDLALDVYGYYT